MGQGILAYPSAALSERERVVVGAQDGGKAAETRGIQFGHKPKLVHISRPEGCRRPDIGTRARSIARDATAITPPLRGCAA